MDEKETLERDKLVTRLRQDLIGPDEADECLSDLPSDVYLTGILWPAQQQDAEDDVALDGGGGDSEAGAEDSAPQRMSTKPSTAGVSFAFRGEGGIRARVTFALYVPGERSKADRILWQRQPFEAFIDVAARKGMTPYMLPGAPDGCELSARIVSYKDYYLATITLVNRIRLHPEHSRHELEEATLFQVGLEVTPSDGAVLFPRPSLAQPGDDEDEQVSALLYRHVREYATGHNCAAEWSELDGQAGRISIAWIPTAVVKSVSAEGCKEFGPLVSRGLDGPLGADWLAVASKANLLGGLRDFADCYRRWISGVAAKVPSLETEEYRDKGEANMVRCHRACDRIHEGIDLLEKDAAALESFRLANRAMAKQRSWSHPDSPLQWRPFQLAFILLNCPSLLKADHPDRNTMDLLWFPTGGGKTEAYLGLVALIAFYRRLSRKQPDEGGGVAVLMRYTLRLLTTQQFERAAAVMMACELLRRSSPEFGERLGSTPFSIGLWVGGDATPNNFENGRASLIGVSESGGSPIQLKNCPACRSRLTWSANIAFQQIDVHCKTSGCELNFGAAPLPVHTVDSDVYRSRPTLLIGTVDKFAQITTNVKIRSIFALDEGAPPDLILQDELHLISGPLGTVTALYEVAVDRLASRGPSRPKIIGSTATIRRAQEQIRALFDRNAFQFPPPGLDASDSGFAIVDETHPGRLYCGVTSAGRSPKFTLQAVTASLLQAATTLHVEKSDDYWTLLEYFNSLRELGGALVMMQDDVNDSVASYALRHGEEPRELDPPEELTSRRTQTEILEMLDVLGLKKGEDGAVDMVLATNMISVGVDVQRLGLMVVNGQPKGISEYIQATSRVGRKKSAPGLVVAIYNSSRARDRSHYETFTTWHQAIYRDVEAMSVTPFAPRSRDKALHAVLAALVRHQVCGMVESPEKIRDALRPEIEAVVDYIVERAARIDSAEADVRYDLEGRLLSWEALARPDYYERFSPGTSLMQDAERAAALRAAKRKEGDAWPVMNNMRSVEPSTELRLYIPPSKKGTA